MNLEMDPCLLEQLDEQLDRGEYNSGALCSYGCPAGSVLFFAEATYHAGQTIAKSAHRNCLYLLHPIPS